MILKTRMVFVGECIILLHFQISERIKTNSKYVVLGAKELTKPPERMWDFSTKTNEIMLRWPIARLNDPSILLGHHHEAIPWRWSMVLRHRSHRLHELEFRWR